MKALTRGAAALALLFGAPAAAQAPAWDPQPWLQDLAEFRAALETKYANLDWLQTEREVDVADGARIATRRAEPSGTPGGAA